MEPAQPDPLRGFWSFSTTDLWRHGGFAHGGVLWASSGLDQEGPVLKLLFGGGIYHYVSGASCNAEVRGTELAAAILPGWRFVRNGVSITMFLGCNDFQQHRLSPDDLPPRDCAAVTTARAPVLNSGINRAPRR